jgi:hypothetical protein
MRRTFGTHVRLDEEAMCKSNRIRRGSRQPLSRFVNIIVHDFLDTVRSEQRRCRRTLRSSGGRRRA